MGQKKVSLLERCPYFRGVLRERFHCIYNVSFISLSLAPYISAFISLPHTHSLSSSPSLPSSISFSPLPPYPLSLLAGQNTPAVVQSIPPQTPQMPIQFTFTSPPAAPPSQTPTPQPQSQMVRCLYQSSLTLNFVSSTSRGIHVSCPRCCHLAQPVHARNRVCVNLNSLLIRKLGSLSVSVMIELNHRAQCRK